MSVKNSTIPSFPRTFVQDFPSPSSVEKEQNGNSSQLSPNEFFADSTYLQIDDQGVNRFTKLRENTSLSTIHTWLGHNARDIARKTRKISVKDARLINQNSKTTIFEIDEEHLIEFKVSNTARETLQQLAKTNNFTQTSNELGFREHFLAKIKGNLTHSISKENAKKIDEFFKTDVFQIHQIFDRACTEKINQGIEKQNNFDELTRITFDIQSQNKVQELDPPIRTKISKMIGYTIYSSPSTISIRNAVAINQILQLKIFEFSVEKISTLPFTNEECDQLNKLIAEKIKAGRSQSSIIQDLDVHDSEFRPLREGKQKVINLATAIKIQNYFNTKLFDFEKILNEALADALHFYESNKMALPAPKKQKINDQEKIPAKSNLSPSSVEKEQNVNSSQLSPNEFFADSTYFRIDDQAVNRFTKLRENTRLSTIHAWLGHSAKEIARKTRKISVKDARLINQNSETTIFEIDEKHLIEFKVPDAARKTVQQLAKTYNFKITSEELGFESNFLHKIKKNLTHSISIENAKKIDEFFEKDVFCIHQIFDRACTENINGGIEKQSLGNSDKLIRITFDTQSQNKVTELDPSIKTKISKLIGTSIYRPKLTISIRDAVVINQVSKLKIFEFSVEKISTFPFTNEACSQLNELIKKNRTKVALGDLIKDLDIPYHEINSLLKGKDKKIYLATAIKIENYFKIKLFDFNKVLSQALTDALHFYSKIPAEEKEEISQPSTKKRRSHELFGEEKAVPSPKKQKINAQEKIPATEEMLVSTDSNADGSDLAYPQSTLGITTQQLSPTETQAWPTPHTAVEDDSSPESTLVLTRNPETTDETSDQQQSFSWTNDEWMPLSIDDAIQANREESESFDPSLPNYNFTTNFASSTSNDPELAYTQSTPGITPQQLSPRTETQAWLTPNPAVEDNSSPELNLVPTRKDETTENISDQQQSLSWNSEGGMPLSSDDPIPEFDPFSPNYNFSTNSESNTNDPELDFPFFSNE